MKEIVKRISEAMPIGKLRGDVWTTLRLPVLVFITAGACDHFGGLV